MPHKYVLPYLPAGLPVNAVKEGVDTNALSEQFTQILNSLEEKNFKGDAVWRDHFALTGSIRTFYGPGSIGNAFRETSEVVKPRNFVIPQPGHVMRPGKFGWVEMYFQFETNGIPATTASGFLSVVPVNGEWKIWVLRTILEELTGYESVDRLEPVHSFSNGTNGINGTTNGAHDTNGVEGHSNGEKTHFETVVVGGGQAGLCTGGRLKALGLSYVVIDKHDHAGDSWRTRYDSTRLHTIREFAQLPFEKTFPDTYQEFLVKDELADAHERWVKNYGINLWSSTILESGSWDEEEGIWTLNLFRSGEVQQVTARWIVLAVGGGSQVPLTPTYENEESFRGVKLHSAAYKSSAEWKGKHGVIVGTANTAHDVAVDMVNAGLASVTMIQRSKTLVVPIEHYMPVHKMAYTDDRTTEMADRIVLTGPNAISRLVSRATLLGRAAADHKRFDDLERAGFLLDRDGDMLYNMFERQGAHYMDVGASGKIAKGEIKIKSDSLPVAYTEDGLECANGDRLKADVIIFCTGFLGNVKFLIGDLLGGDVANQVEDYWGLDAEGELRGAFRPSGHPGLFMVGGAVGQARFMTRFTALQIKAMTIGTPLPVYAGERRVMPVLE